MLGVLGSLLGSRSGRMIGGMIGGRHGAMLGGLAGAMLGGSQIRRLGGFIGGLNDRGGAADTDARPPSGDDKAISEDDAELLVRAMCNAAKADGHIDGDEANRIVEETGAEAAADEQIFLRRELHSPHLPARQFAADIRPDLAFDVYAVSVLAITVDTMEEAMYLRDLRDALGLSHSDVDAIHDQLSVPRL
ncbi:MAG: tellurite resistance TerB family protein [Acidimicrobiia bacterium]|nr:tellurite resistance TerB family protein [Acidimicrobiia bacterium]